jgi:Holliday junction resolvase-like predicted endonuclease
MRTSYGEVDLLFVDGETLVAVEVKTRVASGAEVVTQKQLARIGRALEFIALANGHPGPLRVDLITVSRDSIRRYQNVLQA